MFSDIERAHSVMLELSHSVWHNQNHSGQAQKSVIRGMLYPRAEAIEGRVRGQDSCLPSSMVIPPEILDGKSVPYSRLTQQWVSFQVS